MDSIEEKNQIIGGVLHTISPIMPDNAANDLTKGYTEGSCWFRVSDPYQGVGDLRIFKYKRPDPITVVSVKRTWAWEEIERDSIINKDILTWSDKELAAIQTTEKIVPPPAEP